MLYACGTNKFFQLGVTISNNNIPKPENVSFFNGAIIEGITTNGNLTFFLASSLILKINLKFKLNFFF
jgi:hypothetical protein